MFKIFSFGFQDINVAKINDTFRSFFNNIDINDLTEKYTDNFLYEYQGKMDGGKSDFIQLEEYEEMYFLTIDLRGIDLREVSIRYDLGIIEVNLNRTEVEKNHFGFMRQNRIIKKSYNKKFENIEEIDTDQILKSIDNNILSVRMLKKYLLSSLVIDVESYDES